MNKDTNTPATTAQVQLSEIVFYGFKHRKVSYQCILLPKERPPC